ncbi:type II toxin-antitoxin system RelE family toxin [Methylobacterium haplocladii]|uniref:Cytotoxic translational repressor of toxin-antitoxin stability system n=1 Tax=Methylobacterium haplocladii TaxID=1176176 RepID=A0A512IP07_9HYPH|nr:type II toxin-antitoxin system RelE/ParE family toxin [Methylobacterium haplocladii]GEO99447.1 hypothetical protein MHA02_18350 [Methylobacterium haplocladii]GJD83276.1 hypothetical protein HPGCJGGD_1142 [Methylobacterium haplocladii]GLS58924.1 hypothetical protein GCM10007887_15900 [Methylobacterium haplocladii]
MNKTLIFAVGPGRAFWKLPLEVQESLTQKLYQYGLTGIGDVKRLTGFNRLRLRDGEYRIVFEESATSLTVVTVAHRREVYR